MTIMQDQPVALGGPEPDTVSRVIVGVDDARPGLAALVAATNLARSAGSELVAVRAWALGLPRHGGRRLRHLSHPHVGAVLRPGSADLDSAAIGEQCVARG